MGFSAYYAIEFIRHEIHFVSISVPLMPKFPNISVEHSKIIILFIDGAIMALNLAIDRFVIRSPNGGGYSCKKCHKFFNQKHNLRNHIEAKHVETDGFTCNSCGKLFKTRNSLNVHISKTHTNATPYIGGTSDSGNQNYHYQY